MRARYCFSSLFLAMLLGISLNGCHTSAYPLTITHGQHESLPHASSAELQGSLDRLKQEMRRSIKQMNWAMLRSTTSISPDSEGLESFEARALMPSGESVHILGRVTPSHENNASTLLVTIQVGRFGDRQAQTRYLENLQQILSSKPLPERGLTFEMPPLEKYQQAYEPRYELQD